MDAKNNTEWRHEIQSTLNKVGRITLVPALRNVLGRPPTLNFRKLMDEGKILICDLNVGTLGVGPASLLGTFVGSEITAAAQARAVDGTPSPFYLYVDECKYFVTDTFETVLSEA